MSKIFSRIEASDGFKSYEFYAPGWVQDEDDFINTDFGSNIMDIMTGDFDVDVRVYCFGEGESYPADDEDVELLTEEFIEKECDCIQTISFTIHMEDEE